MFTAYTHAKLKTQQTFKTEYKKKCFNLKQVVWSDLHPKKKKTQNKKKKNVLFLEAISKQIFWCWLRLMNSYIFYLINLSECNQTDG